MVQWSAGSPRSPLVTSRICVFLLLLFFVLPGAMGWDDKPAAATGQPWPEVTLANARITARVMLPDPATGFYRGRRFEQAGLVSTVTGGGHTYIGDPGAGTDFGYSLGICGEFLETIPLPDDQDDRRTFLRIGQGVFARKKEGPDHPKNDVPVRAATWETRHTSAHRTEFRQEFTEGNAGYVLEKTISLAEDAPELTVSYKLRNTGTIRLETRHYSHNWLTLDGKTISPDLALVIPWDFVPSVETFLGKNGLRMGARGLTFGEEAARPTAPTSFMRTRRTSGREKNQFLLRDTTTRAAVWISNDWPDFSFDVYIEKRGYCPESFCPLSLAPGEETAWSSTYRFLRAEDPLPEWAATP